MAGANISTMAFTSLVSFLKRGAFILTGDLKWNSLISSVLLHAVSSLEIEEMYTV